MLSAVAGLNHYSCHYFARHLSLPGSEPAPKIDREGCDTSSRWVHSPTFEVSPHPRHLFVSGVMVNRPADEEISAEPSGAAQPAGGSRIVAAPAGTPFQRLGRTSRHRWWRPLVGSVLLWLATAFGVPALAVRVSLFIQEELHQGGLDLPNIGLFVTPGTIDFAILLSAAGLATPLVLLCAWSVQRRPMGSLSSVAGRLRRRWLIVCVGLALGAYALKFGFEYGLAVLTDIPAPTPTWWVGWEAFWPPLLVIVVLTPFQATAEEYLFRGWLLQAIAAYTLETPTRRVGRILALVLRTPWPAIVISAFAFALAHDYTGLGMVNIFVFGAAMAWLAVRTGGLEASIAWHTVNNVVVFGVIAAVSGLNSMEQGDMAWQYVAADVTATGMFAAAVVLLGRRRKLATTSGRPATPVAESAHRPVGS
jgi:membrane protease YdiL (CAAX protease family)